MLRTIFFALTLTIVEVFCSETYSPVLGYSALRPASVSLSEMAHSRFCCSVFLVCWHSQWCSWSHHWAPRFSPGNPPGSLPLISLISSSFYVWATILRCCSLCLLRWISSHYCDEQLLLNLWKRIVLVKHSHTQQFYLLCLQIFSILTLIRVWWYEHKDGFQEFFSVN